jgi:pSer/pThr/pTyr-binding forkhead associated (FHA) protein
MAYLVIRTDGDDPKRLELKGPVTFGRSIECDVWLNDAGVSRRHCRVARDLPQGGWLVEDLGSRNGVHVNHQRITGPHHLNDGDVLRIGPARVAFHAVGFVPERPVVPTPSMDTVDETLDEVSKPTDPRPRPKATADHPGTSPRPTEKLAFKRPPARPIVNPSDVPASGSVDQDRSAEAESFVRRWLRR